MKEMCKKRFESNYVYRNELSNPRCFTVSVNSPESHLHTTVRQLGLESFIRHTQGWLKLIILDVFVLTMWMHRG